MRRSIVLGLTALWLAACGGAASSPSSTRPLAIASPTASPASRLPERVWVNTPLGANVRTDHDAAATRVALVRQAGALRVERGWPDQNPQWYEVSAEDFKGWISRTLVVDVPIQRTGAGELVTLALPDGLYGSSARNEYTVRTGPQATDPVFLRVRRAASDAELPVQDPGVIDHEQVVEVWSFTGLERVYRRPDGTAYYVIRVPGEATSRYLLEFFDRNTSSARVQQVLDSMTLY